MTTFKLFKNTHLRLFPFYAFYGIVIFLSLHFYFFWDKDILNSRQAFWFLKNGFSLLPPPGNIDSGHPPIIGLLLAFLWKLFGISTIAGHLAMLPFALGLVFQFYKFTCYFFKPQSVYKVLFLIMIDTSIMTQLVILTGDLLTLFFFFLSINAVLYKKNYLLVIAVAALALSSSRGMLSCLIVGLFHYYLVFTKDDGIKLKTKQILDIIPMYLPAFLLITGYSFYHYHKTGWIGYDKNSSWAGCFEVVNFKGFIKNIFILSWRLMDFGRLFVWLAGIYVFILYIRKQLEIDEKIKILLALIIISLIVYSPPMLVYKILSSHRYILPVFVVIVTLVSYIIFEKLNNKHIQNTIYIILVAGLISGNFWVYPDKIAKGWDATLAHIPYYGLRLKMIQYLDEQKVPFNKVLSDVPNVSPLNYVDLSGDYRHFEQEKMEACDYVFYSNIFNNFTDEQIDELKSKWILVKEYKQMQVFVRLYKRPKKSIVKTD